MTAPQILDNRYEVGELIGRGGMADVHRGRDIRLGREVAIKLLRRDLARDPMFQSRFRREAKAVAGLNHPAIVSVYDTGEEDFGPDAEAAHGLKVPFIVMEFVDGRTLRDLLAADEIDVDRAIDYMLGLLSALSYSHGKSIVHRDIKPANVMVTSDGSVKVMDFGIARALADSAATMTQTQAVVGTAQYLSPEQARGEHVDVRSDLYSAGCLLFELLVGRPPFVGDSAVSVAYQHVGEDAAAPSELNDAVPTAIDSVVATALAKNREDRFQTAADFAHALREARDGVPYVAGAVAGAAGAAAAGAAAAAAAQDGDSKYDGEGPTEALSVSDAATSALPAHLPTTPLSAASAHEYDPESSHDAASASDAEPETAPATSSLDTITRADHRERSNYERRRRRAWITVFTLVTLLVLAGGGWFVWDWTQRVQAQNARVAVPVVEGMSQTDAQNTLYAEQLRISGIEEEFSDDVEPGFAIGTRPGDGEEVRIDSSVVLIMSKGPSSVTVPDLEGVTESTARARLAELGLEVDINPDPENHPTVPEDRVISTNPATDESVTAGTVVELILSTGQVSVPDLIADGLTVDEAEEVLGDPAYGLSVGTVTEEVNSVVEPGEIIETSPGPGEDIEQGGSVDVTIAVAPPEPEPEPEPEPTDSAEPEESTPPESETPEPESPGNGGGNGNGNGGGNGNGNGNS